ncbi:MAG: response regulator transcription factor [Chloroflexi bacterium]|nr:response regulator transcription factor [Chloroflexota bacterium]
MRQATPLRVLVVDDHELVRIGLRTVLGGAPGLIVVGEAGSVAEAIVAARKHQPDVVLMDVRLPDGSGVEACREIRSAQPATAVLMLTSFADDDAALSAIVAGASGYLLKQAKVQTLLDAIETVGHGGSLLDPVVTGKVMERIRSSAAAPPPGDKLASLSEKERKILSLIAEGQTNREIAETLYLSEHTVKGYVSDLLSKLQLRRRSEAAAFFERHQGKPPG